MADANRSGDVVAEAMLAQVREAASALVPPLQAYLEVAPATASELPALRFSTLPCDPVVRAYTDGSFIAQASFAVCHRSQVACTADRQDAVGALAQVAAALEACDPALPEGYAYFKTTVASTPSIYDSDPDGAYEEYQVTFRTEYMVAEAT